MLPPYLQNRIQSLLESASSKSALVVAREQLSKRYRALHEHTQGGFASSEIFAYLAARLPATFAAVEAVLSHVPSKNLS